LRPKLDYGDVSPCAAWRGQIADYDDAQSDGAHEKYERERHDGLKPCECAAQDLHDDVQRSSDDDGALLSFEQA